MMERSVVRTLAVSEEIIGAGREGASPSFPPSFRRPCPECGKMHDTGRQNMKSGAMIERFDKCYDCIMKKAYKNAPISKQVILRDEM